MVKARNEPGTSLRNVSARGVKAKQPWASSVKTPTLASARSTRWRDGAWVPVRCARSMLDFGPSCNKSARPSLAARYRARDSQKPAIIWSMTTGDGTAVAGLEVSGVAIRILPPLPSCRRTEPAKDYSWPCSAVKQSALGVGIRQPSAVVSSGSAVRYQLIKDTFEPWNDTADRPHQISARGSAPRAGQP